MKKQDKVILFAPNLSKEEEFDLSHAQEIIRLQEQGKITGKRAWGLPENSEYEIIDGKLIKQSDQGNNKETGKTKGDRASN